MLTIKPVCWRGLIAMVLLVCGGTIAPCQRRHPKRTAMCKIVASLKSEDKGKQLDLHLGEGVTVTLSEMASAGYTWQSVVEPTTVLALEDSRRSAQPDSGMGGSMIRTMTFCAKSAGNAQIKLKLRRPWEHSGEPAQTFQFQVTVR